MEEKSSKEAADEARTTVLRVRICPGLFEGSRGKKAREGGCGEGRGRGENQREEERVAINDGHSLALALSLSLSPLPVTGGPASAKTSTAKGSFVSIPFFLGKKKRELTLLFLLNYFDFVYFVPNLRKQQFCPLNFFLL